MNFHDTQTSRVLKQHYEKLLLSYDVYETGIYEEQTDLSNPKSTKKIDFVDLRNLFFSRLLFS